MTFEIIQWGVPIIVILLCAGCWMAGYSAGSKQAEEEFVGPPSDDLTIAYMSGYQDGKDRAKRDTAPQGARHDQ